MDWVGLGLDFGTGIDNYYGDYCYYDPHGWILIIMDMDMVISMVTMKRHDGSETETACLEGRKRRKSDLVFKFYTILFRFEDGV